jgi:hypothetical protein
MPFSVDQLATVAECDEVLKYADDERDALLFRINVYTYSQENAEETSEEVNDTITGIDQELVGINAFLATNPTGKLAKEYSRKKTKLENRKEELGFRSEDIGGVSLLKKELELRQAQAQLVETDQCIAEVNARKTALS